MPFMTMNIFAALNGAISLLKDKYHVKVIVVNVYITSSASTVT